MSHSPSRRTVDKEMARRRAEADHDAAAELATERAVARRYIALWNARAARGRPHLTFPTINAAIVAGTPFLRYLCPACHQVGETDLRRQDRHPDATVASLIIDLSCTRCSPNPPLAQLIGLEELPLRPAASRLA